MLSLCQDLRASPQRSCRFCIDRALRSTSILSDLSLTMATATQQHILLAQSLPRQLLHFFKRFPPPQITASATVSKPVQGVQIAANTSSSDPNVGASSTTIPTEAPADSPSEAVAWKKNPFLPFKNPRTGHWHPPHYSLRRQAQLFKLAAAHHVLPLMPYSHKHPEVKAQKRIEHGLRVKGTGEGQKVKGHHWERTLQSRMEVRRKAMESMPDMITLWKERGHGRGWKKYPSGKSKSAKNMESDIFRSDMRHAWVHAKAISG